jgi:hypothetical protein
MSPSLQSHHNKQRNSLQLSMSPRFSIRPKLSRNNKTHKKHTMRLSCSRNKEGDQEQRNQSWCLNTSLLIKLLMSNHLRQLLGTSSCVQTVKLQRCYLKVRTKALPKPDQQVRKLPATETAFTSPILRMQRTMKTL